MDSQLATGLAAPRGVPAGVRAAYNPADDPLVAQRYTWELAHSHYENFSVVSQLLPRYLRQDFCNVYAFCRIADDLGDEVHDSALSLSLLADFRRRTQECYGGTPTTAIFMALAQTIRRYEIPLEPFLDLISAFEQDQTVTRYESFAQVLDYCRRSADPVGRLVLYMCGYRDQRRQQLSDKTCSALQLINFCQDIRRDILERDRVYLPADSMRRFGVSVQQLRDGRVDDNFRRLLEFECDRVAGMFAQGRELLPLIRLSLRPQIALFGLGGAAVLRAIRRADYDTLSHRPALSKVDKLRLLVPAGIGSLMASVLPRRSA
jgi:squalene synthase HpnC